MNAAIETQRDLPQELAAVYATEGARLWRAVYAFAGDRELASDAVAEAFAQCLRRGDAVRDPRAWVWRSAFRIAAGELQRRRLVTHDVPDRPYEMDLDAGEVLVTMLARLSPMQRAVLVLRHYAGEETDVIAATLGMSRATVRVHLRRGRLRLAAMLEEDEA